MIHLWYVECVVKGRAYRFLGNHGFLPKGSNLRRSQIGYRILAVGDVNSHETCVRKGKWKCSLYLNFKGITGYECHTILQSFKEKYHIAWLPVFGEITWFLVFRGNPKPRGIQSLYSTTSPNQNVDIPVLSQIHVTLRICARAWPPSGSETRVTLVFGEVPSCDFRLFGKSLSHRVFRYTGGAPLSASLEPLTPTGK